MKNFIVYISFEPKTKYGLYLKACMFIYYKYFIILWIFLIDCSQLLVKYREILTIPEGIKSILFVSGKKTQVVHKCKYHLVNIL